jgi:hypothetical protein
MNIANNRNIIFKDGYLEAETGIKDESIPMSKLQGSLDLSCIHLFIRFGF